jgi:hypothetical protein
MKLLQKALDDNENAVVDEGSLKEYSVDDDHDDTTTVPLPQKFGSSPMTDVDMIGKSAGRCEEKRAEPEVWKNVRQYEVRLWVVQSSLGSPLPL